MSKSNYGPIVPEGQYPPFAVVTPEDHSAWIIIAAALGLASSLVFGAIRVFVRQSISPQYGLDDITLGSSTILAIIQSSIVLGACSKGLGKSLDLLSPEAQTEVQRMYYASNLFFVLALGLSKSSVVFFLRRLTAAKHHKLVFDTANVLIAAWAIGSFFAVALQCNLSHPWISAGESCSGTLLRWQIISAIDIIIEVALVSLATYLVWSLRTSKSSKAVVITAFGCRLFMIVTIAFRLKTFNEAGWTSNPTLLEASFIAWTQSELNYSIVSATIPSFQNFLKNLNTQFGGLGPDASSYGYGSGSGSRAHKNTNNSFQMSKLRSATESRTEPETDDRRIVIAKSDDVANTAQNHRLGSNTSAGNLTDGKDSGVGTDAISIASDESRRMMIRKDVTWNIVTEAR